MPRAQSFPDYAEPARDPVAGEWQALRGELVALLDKVENHYGKAEPEPAMSGLSRRVQNLRDQMDGTEGASRRREALKTVKRAVDRFSERDAPPVQPEHDDLTAAIAQIRSRQGVQPQPMRRATDMPEIRELGTLVGGLSNRLERLEDELRTQRSGGGQVREVASQVEQLTQVVELLAGAIGETGQVKRLEVQIAALGAMIEEAPRVDLAAVNARLDDVSATVGKLAELQAQQMEREIVRDKQHNLAPELAKVVPAMDAIEISVRSVYDRIDAIERGVALSSADFERLTGEMAAFTQAMRDKTSGPDALVARVEALAQRFEGLDSADGNVAGLKTDIAGLREAVLQGMEPRFLRLESQIEALNGRIAPSDGGAVEAQLKALMARMDDAGAQLDGLSRLYHAGESKPDLESLATMVAERTSEAMSRKAPAPVAMFGADSLKSIEDRLTGLIKSAGKTPDYDTLADMIAVKAGEAVSKAAPAAGGSEGLEALEKRMTALLNTAGKDTAERLARLEATLTGRTDLLAAPTQAARPAPAQQGPTEDAFATAMQPPRKSNDRLDAILADLGRENRDTMPTNPADEAPLIDSAGKPAHRAAPKAAAPAPKKPAALTPAVEATQHRFDADQAQKPPRPRSSFAADDHDPFAEPPPRPSAVEPVVATTTSTSTFVAAARRAQRAKQDDVAEAGNNSLVARALARVRPRLSAETAIDPAAPAAPPRQSRKEERQAAKAARVAAKPERAPKAAAADGEVQQSFLTRHRRPLLLAATLVAVSMLALNLVMQRSNPPAEQPAAPLVAPAETTTPASGDVSSAVPPRVIDLVDTTSTGSINPGEPMSFSKAALVTAPSTPVPPTLEARSGAVMLAPKPETFETVIAALHEAPQTTGSISPSAVETETFELPPEAIGPLELREAAAGGDAQAQFEVAAIFGEGRAVEKDLEEAARWYERSAAQGFVPAQYRLGNLYEMGSGVDKDLEQARLWYQRGAEAGNRMSMHNLAALYAGGELGEQQFELAAEWFEKAASHGMTDSQFNLGMLYARGLGLEQSFEQSYKWFSLAARSGDKDAAQARDDIAKSLTADAVKRLDSEVAAWKIAAVDLAANFAPMGTWSSTFDPGQPVSTRDVILKVQQALGKLGFDVGTPDGVAGPKTTEAIKAFERATGMSAVGVVNPRLLAVLGSQPV